MKNYTKKPVTIEAVQWDGSSLASRRIESWSEGAVVFTQNALGEGHLEVVTLEGTMSAFVYDWIIKGVNGEFYPCKDDIFKKTYTPAEHVPDQYMLSGVVHESIRRRFTYHPPKGNQTQRYIQLRDAGKELALLIVGQTPESREQSLALTKLEEVIMWANAAIARNE